MWSAFSNHYWPALYFVDAEGAIRHHHYGEGAYERSEWVIQELLAEAGARDVDTGLVAVEGQGDEAAADWDALGSPETYLGYERADNFASPGGVARDEQRLYTLPSELMLNHWALSGSWTVGAGACRSTSRAAASPSASSPVICISSWGRRRPTARCAFA